MINKILVVTRPYFGLTPSIDIKNLTTRIGNFVQKNLGDTENNIFSYFFQEVTHQSHIRIHSSKKYINNDTLLSVVDDANLAYKITVGDFVRQMNKITNPPTENQKFISIVKFFEENNIRISYIKE